MIRVFMVRDPKSPVFAYVATKPGEKPLIVGCDTSFSTADNAINLRFAAIKCLRSGIRMEWDAGFDVDRIDPEPPNELIAEVFPPRSSREGA